MGAFNVMAKRVSVRKYKKKAVPRMWVKKIVDAGRRAPTAMGVEPWEFVAVTKKEIVRKLGEEVAPCHFVKDAACCILVFCKETKYYLEDGCAATENMLLAAADLGLGGCWIAGEKEPWGKGLYGLLKMPKRFHWVSMVALGWPDENVKQKRNRSLREVLHWETFRSKRQGSAGRKGNL